MPNVPIKEVVYRTALMRYSDVLLYTVLTDASIVDIHTI